jgi:hypothetical protein
MWLSIYASWVAEVRKSLGTDPSPPNNANLKLFFRPCFFPSETNTRKVFNEGDWIAPSIVALRSIVVRPKIGIVIFGVADPGLH